MDDKSYTCRGCEDSDAFPHDAICNDNHSRCDHDAEGVCIPKPLSAATQPVKSVTPSDFAHLLTAPRPKIAIVKALRERTGLPLADCIMLVHNWLATAYVKRECPTCHGSGLL